jgi:hypothetical protein
MNQTFDTFVPTLKQQKLIATAEAIAIDNDKKQDAATLKAAKEQALAFFAQHRYWWINDGEMIFDQETGLLWQGKPSDKTYHYSYQNQANQDLLPLKLGGLSGWHVPLDQELKNILKPKSFPLKSGSSFRICDYHFWLTQNNQVIYLDDSSLINSSWSSARVLAVNSCFKTKPSAAEAFNVFFQKKWKMRPHGIQPNES